MQALSNFIHIRCLAIWSTPTHNITAHEFHNLRRVLYEHYKYVFSLSTPALEIAEKIYKY